MTDLFGNETAKATVYKNKTVQNQPSTNIHPLKSKAEIVPAMFEDSPIRRTVENGTVYYSIVDVVRAITSSKNPNALWGMTKKVLSSEGLQLLNIIYRFKLTASDGKKRLTDCADQAGIILIIEYLHSPKAAPFRVWFSHLASERIEEIENPEKGIENSMRRWEEMGKSNAWIETRVKGIAIRKQETSVLQSHGISAPKDFAHFTDRTNKAVYGHKAKVEKELKKVGKGGNLRDGSSQTELILLSLHEDSCARGIESSNAYGKAQIDGVYDIVGGIISSTKSALDCAFGKR